MKKPAPPQLVYILTNSIMPDLIKIGHTTDLEKRVKDLSSHAGVPVAFECYYCCVVEDMKDIEKRLHIGLGDHRINPKREFFRINPERVKMLLEGYSIGDVILDNNAIYTPEENASIARERLRQPVFTFSMLGIELGSTLTFLKDEAKVATVTGDREIEFEGSRGYISPITVDILQKHFGGTLTSLRGSDYWIFEGETLTERRIKMENG